MQTLGNVLRERLLQSRLLRQNRRITKASEAIRAAIDEAGEGTLTATNRRSCNDAARKMDDILFSAGGAERVVKTLQYFKDRAVVQEVALARDAMTKEDGAGSGANYLSKRREAQRGCDE